MLHLLLPSWHRCAADPILAHGTLARWLAQGNRPSRIDGGRESILRQYFSFDAEFVPVAALTREADAHDAGSSVWLRADPAHVHADLAAARMLACGDLGLSLAEAQTLGAELQPLFAEHGLRLETTTPSRWYLRCSVTDVVPQFASPETVLGDDLFLHMPSGESGRRWRRLLSDVQIALHQHPLNLERAARGQRTVNSLWFWGGGALPSSITSELDRVISNDALVLALAQRAGIAEQEAVPDRLADLVAALQPQQTILLDLDERRDGARLERDWLLPLASALQRGSIRALRLQFGSGESAIVRGVHRWRFWRRVRPLQASADAQEIAGFAGDKHAEA